MIRALTGFSTRNPWKVIALWAVIGMFLTLLSQALVYRVTETQSGDFLPAKYDSAAALKIAEERFGVQPDANAVTVLVAREDGKPSPDPTTAASPPSPRSWAASGSRCPSRRRTPPPS